MADSFILFADKTEELVFARENSQKTVRFASNLSILARIIEKFFSDPVLVSENCINQTFLIFAKENSLTFSPYKNLDGLKKLLSDKNEKAPETIVHPEDKKASKIENYDSLYELSPTFASIVGKSPVIQRLRKDMVKAAAFDVPILLLGETGTGKTTVARAIHELSPRRNKIFKDEVLSNMNETLVESKLFGVVQGAFTGAVAGKGLFEEADGGTLFLDEIGEISTSVQVKLLKVLSSRIISRVGSNKEIHVDNRMIFATNANLERKILEKTFREDLFYRINDVTLKIPPLRERPEDIPDLCRAFLKRQKIQKEISESTLSLLQTFPWKGNIRQLEKCIRNAALLYCEGDIILPNHIKL